MAAALPSVDSAISMNIDQLLNSTEFNKELSYPASVVRFYKKRKSQPLWVNAAGDAKLTLEGMLLVDCVLQFGLDHNDYHPKDLPSTLLHQILEKPATTSHQSKARFDIMLTDALITLINHLHFGKLNPAYPASRTDRINGTSFRAETVLEKAVASKDLAQIGMVQPNTRQYWLLQENMRLITMQYTGDCYEMPEGDVQLMAINMERLRWINTADSTYIQINIPAYSLELNCPDTTYKFRVIVGKIQTPTPSLLSKITYLTTAPEWKIPNRIFEKELLPKIIRDTDFLQNNHLALYDKNGYLVQPDQKKLAAITKDPKSYFAKQSAGCDNALGKLVFRFPNIYQIYLHDTPQKHLFNREVRALSHGCIRVERVEELAKLILDRTGTEKQIPDVQRALANEITKSFYLNKPLPIKITYLTCEYINGVLVKYKDVYDLDKRLGMAMYGKESLIAEHLPKNM